ncbi:hypothetical protein FSARC_3432 [Fusarium sarcochroum]|uniref:BZIP domain-containing protein n=1 Tax=Fusarium sarcochroum TaxID=1208366 RepID=A0A8H4U457_9HYPO|nr:hypothetical protein FSARC_3432 [Fusarium sarcochroum]
MTDASSVDASTASQKRLRNRLSQQAFRKRQTAYIKDLEGRLEIRDNDENGQIAQLERDNRALREQLTKACSKLERIQITLRSLSDTMMSHVSHSSKADLPNPQDLMPRSSLDNYDEGDAIETTKNDMAQLQTSASASASTSPETAEQREEPSRPGPNQDVDPFFPPIESDDLAMNDHDANEVVMANLDSFSTAPPISGTQEALSLDTSLLLDRFSHIRTLSGIWSHEYQMGPSAFQGRSPSMDKISRGLAGTNSSFSDHTQMIRSCLVKQWTKANSIQSKTVTEDGLRLSSTVMLSLFHSLSRPAILIWYTATKFQENVADLLLWQMNRSRVVYARLHANYRPSALQIIEHYPSVIDWCPFPTIRDKLILLHAANPCLDQIICDIATAYSVEVDAGKVVLGQTGKGYIRVWDLVCAFETEENDTDDASPSVMFDCSSVPGAQVPFLLPAPSVECLFEPHYARAAFKALGLDDGVPRFKVDPSIFVQYPELYDSGVDIIATGSAFAPEVQTKIPAPTSPKPDTLGIYQNVADWCVSAICKVTLM